MPTIQEGTGDRIVTPDISLVGRPDNLRKLNLEESIAHLTQLSRILRKSSEIISTENDFELVPNSDNQLSDYVIQLFNTVDALLHRNMLEARKPNADIAWETTIAKNSGYPCFVRDICILRDDQKRAPKDLEKVPNDNDLVEGALFSLFRNFFPEDIITQKLTRDHLENLLKMQIPDEIIIGEEDAIKKVKDARIYNKTFSRLDVNNDTPRFYRLFFKVPLRTELNDDLKKQINTTILKGFSTVTDLELPYLASIIDSLEGVQVMQIDRYDIGPFYNKFTDNPKEVQKALALGKPDDSILMIQKQSVGRFSEMPRRGWRERLNALLSGKYFMGIFSPVISSPQYAILAHRLIQSLYYHHQILGDNVRMYGITLNGDSK